MFTQLLSPRLRDRVLRSPLIDILTGPHGTDTYTELLDRSWTDREARATVVDVRRQTARSVTLTLRPNPLGEQLFAKFRAGQYLNVTVEIDGRRHTRCYSPANAEGAALIELTVGVHDGGLVSSHLYRNARPGMVLGISEPAGDFTLAGPPQRRILFLSGGSGITPVLSMVRTLRADGHTGELAFVHYSRGPEDTCYRPELAELPGVRVLHSYTRGGAGELTGHFVPDHLDVALADADAVYVCGPSALVDAVRAAHPVVYSESFVPPVLEVLEASGGRVSFTDSDIEIVDDGRTLLDQAEAAGLTPESGCRMGICHTCTCLKTRGAVKNLITGEISTADNENVRICVSAPLGDVELKL